MILGCKEWIHKWKDYKYLKSEMNLYQGKLLRFQPNEIVQFKNQAQGTDNITV